MPSNVSQPRSCSASGAHASDHRCFSHRHKFNRMMRHGREIVTPRRKEGPLRGRDELSVAQLRDGLPTLFFRGALFSREWHHFTLLGVAKYLRGNSFQPVAQVARTPHRGLNPKALISTPFLYFVTKPTANQLKTCQGNLAELNLQPDYFLRQSSY